MSADDRTQAVYDAKAADYMKMATSGGAPSQPLAQFLAGLPDGAVILDLGCGPGHTAAHLRDLGYAVTATDASAAMARIAQQTYGLQVTVAAFDDLDAVDAYDGVWASFSLLHAPKARMPGYLAAIRTALRPGGVLSLGLKTGTGERRDALGRFYAYYADAEITGLLASAGFTVTDRQTGADEGLDGTLAPWIVLTAHG
jgi:SAM-dependent methyltransferase